MKKTFSFFIFISVFIFLYGLLHFYLYLKLINVFKPGIYANMILVFSLMIMLFSPILIRKLPENKKSFPLTTAILFTYLWMGSIFLFFSLYILIDFYRFIILFLSYIFSPAFLSLLPSAEKALLSVFIIVILINLYGLYEAGNITIERILLKTKKLPADVASFRIVQISDIHFSRTNGLKLAHKIVSLIESNKPDLLVSTGDLLDRGLLKRERVEKLFRNLNIKYGKFAATGNHEFISGIKKATEFTVNSGFILLRNESISVADFLNIAAVDDPAGKRFEHKSGTSGEEILKGLSKEKINILLKHQPKVEDRSIGKFDLQLSGHTHKGQIFPFNFIVSIFYKYVSGLYELEKGSHLYVNRGTGTWGPPVRFLSPPEITVIDFVSVREKALKHKVDS